MTTLVWLVGIFISVAQTTGGLPVAPAPWDNGPHDALVLPVVRGGRLHVEVTLKIIVGETVERASFITVENLPTCVHPEHVDVQGAPYVISDHISREGKRHWSIVPPNVLFQETTAVIDIDFVNKCSVA